MKMKHKIPLFKCHVKSILMAAKNVDYIVACLLLESGFIEKLSNFIVSVETRYFRDIQTYNLSLALNSFN